MKSPKLSAYIVATFIATAVITYLNEIRFNDAKDCVAEELKNEIKHRVRWGTSYLHYLKQHNNSDKMSVPEFDSYKLIQKMVDQMVYISRHKNSNKKCALSKMHSLLSQLIPLSKRSGNMLSILNDAITATVKLESMYDNIRASNSHTTVNEFIDVAARQLTILAAVTK